MKILKVLKYLAITVTILLIIIIFANNVALVSLYEKFSFWLFPVEQNRNGELFKIVLSILGAGGILFSFYVSLRRAKAMEQGVLRQRESIDIQSEQISITRKAQTDERFKNAIEHLGNEKEPIILGGIAELHQIAKESKAEYAEVVFNILCSYIRSIANIYRKKAEEINYTVIQTIINNLFKNSANTENPYLGLKADLKSSNLISVDLDNVDLSGANLAFCYLPSISNSNLRNSILNKAVFSLCDIVNVNFIGSILHQTIFHASTLENCDFSAKTNLISTAFVDSVIENVNFNGTALNGIKFISSEIINSSFIRSEIISTSFVGSMLLNLDFTNLRLFGSNDCRATGLYNIQINTIITKTRFNGCNSTNRFRYFLKDKLGNSIGKKANLSGVNLNGSQLYECETGEFEQSDFDEIIKEYEDYTEKRIFLNKENENK